MTNLDFTTPYSTRVAVGEDGGLAIVQARQTGDRSDVVILHGAEALAVARAVIERCKPRPVVANGRGGAGGA